MTKFAGYAFPVPTNKAIFMECYNMLKLLKYAR